jgi:hypothetical protein
MKKFSIFKVLAAFLGLVFIGILPGEVLANGDEVLGPPAGITIKSGSRILAAGTGLITQPGTIDITIPLGVTIKQVLLYWQGIRNPDDTIRVEGTTITGSLIGTGYYDRFCYRADITAGGFVIPGPNSLSVSGLTFDVNNGAGVLVMLPKSNFGMGMILLMHLLTHRMIQLSLRHSFLLQKMLADQPLFPCFSRVLAAQLPQVVFDRLLSKLRSVGLRQYITIY